MKQSELEEEGYEFSTAMYIFQMGEKIDRVKDKDTLTVPEPLQRAKPIGSMVASRKRTSMEGAREPIRPEMKKVKGASGRSSIKLFMCHDADSYFVGAEMLRLFQKSK